MRTFVFILALLFINATFFCQLKIDINLDSVCSYNAEKISDDIYTFPPSKEAEEIVRNIIKISGTEQRFTLLAANVPNAVAKIHNGKKLILYSQDFILTIAKSTGTNWASTSIIAHEIGHHISGHTISHGGSRPLNELEADQFSGFICGKMGATLKETKSAINTLPAVASGTTHPPKSARIEAMAIGWNQANSSSREKKDSVVPLITPVTTKTLVNQVLKTTADIALVYTGDNYGCALPISIKINNQTYTPTSNQLIIKDIPLGEQGYTITGNINCPTIGGCMVTGSGTIYVKENSTFYVRWNNVGYSQCRVSLNPY